LATLLIEDPIFLSHLVPEGHPERPDRLRAIEQALADERFAKLDRRAAPRAEIAAIAAAHTADYIAEIEAAVPSDGLLPDRGRHLAVSGKPCGGAARRGGACLAVDEVMTGKAANAFVAARPPGHHAEGDRAMGFCIFNNAAIACPASAPMRQIWRIEEGRISGSS
jgi:acetoin utilization deacetylase AcuC-like enzyme